MKKIFSGIMLILLSCTQKPDKKDLVNKLELHDRNYDLTLYSDNGGVYAPDYGNIYMDFRNGDF